MLKVPPRPADDAVALQAEHQRFCDDMANGLHALAQPLSILRSAAELLVLTKSSGPDHQRYMDLLTTHMRHTCDLFASVQNLLALELEKAKPVQLDFRELLGPVLEECGGAFESQGISLAETIPDGSHPMFCDASRTEQAMTALLEAAASVCEPGDAVGLAVSQAEGLRTVTVRSARKHGKQMHSSARLNLSLARANILSQQGQYHFADDPFCVSFALPEVAPRGVAHSATLSSPCTD
jgi:signal transduction histidine kinase